MIAPAAKVRRFFVVPKECEKAEHQRDFRRGLSETHAWVALAHGLAPAGPPHSPRRHRRGLAPQTPRRSATQSCQGLHRWVCKNLRARPGVPIERLTKRRAGVRPKPGRKQSLMSLPEEGL